MRAFGGGALGRKGQRWGGGGKGESHRGLSNHWGLRSSDGSGPDGPHLQTSQGCAGRQEWTGSISIRQGEGLNSLPIKMSPPARRAIGRLGRRKLGHPAGSKPTVLRECYLANSTTRDSRSTVTLICPGNCNSCSIFRATSRASSVQPSSSSLAGSTMTRTSRPAWIA